MSKIFFVKLIRLYQEVASPFFGKRCRFYPSCSEYAAEALQKKNLLFALRISIFRLLKCHPFHPGGYDPVQ